jgi:hypothetical protein
MAKSKGELIDQLLECIEKISDSLDDLRVPHIFITLKTEPPYGVFYSNTGTFLQGLFLALAVLIKTIEEKPELRPALKTLVGLLEETQINWREEQEEEKRPPEPHPEKMTELDEAFREIFKQVKEKGDEGSEKQG